MVQIAGTYQHVKNENFAEYLAALGVPENQAKEFNNRAPKLQVVVDGKKISLNSDNTKTSVTLDEEVEEKWPNVILKSTAKLDGDTLTVNSKTPDGKLQIRAYKFSDSELVVTLSSNNVTAKRIYKRI